MNTTKPKARRRLWTRKDYKNDPEAADTSNNDRALRAAATLETYEEARGLNYEEGDTQAQEEAITDLITDLLHLCRRSDIDPAAMLKRAEMHHDTERGDL